MASDVTDMINAFRGGAMTLEQIAQRFRERSWPRRTTSMPTTYLELAAAAQQDPEPDLPGSIDEVTAAYDRGDLTRAQYRVLTEAAAESMRAEDQRGVEDSPDSR
jgi:hypothetical protein